MEEFFKQGDIEKEKGMKVSMYCDRDKSEICKSQMGFIKNIAMPLFDAFNKYLASPIIEETCIKQLQCNYNTWEYLEAKGVYENKRSLQFEDDKYEDLSYKSGTGVINTNTFISKEKIFI